MLRSFGGPDAFELAEVPDPSPAEDEVLIRVHTVAANRMDLDTSRGLGPGRVPLPLICGIDPAGDVLGMGAQVDGLRPGDRVVVKPNIACGTCRWCRRGEENACLDHVNVGVHRPGGFAEYIAVPARNAFPIPAALRDEEATALAHSFPVVLSMFRDSAHIGPEDVVLVTGAAGAIGSAAVQLARHFGARVIAAAGAEEKVRLARDLGADDVANYGAEPQFADRVRAFAGPGGVTLLFVTAGDAAVWQEATRTLGRKARVIVCGSHGDEVVPLDLRWLFRNRITIAGSAGSTYAAFREALRLAGAGQIRPVVDRVLPLEAVREAFRILEARANRGKVVLRVAT